MRTAKTLSVFRLPALFSVLAGILLLLSSCNLREDLLLPPNLDPKEYVEGNTIRVYSDYLVKSENDNSYLYIPKESIADSLLWYGDTIVFRKTHSLLQRDSLALVESSLAVTETYDFTILRAGQRMIFDSIPAFATLYTQLTAAAEYLDIHVLSLRYKLKAQPVSVYPYGMMRAFFDLDGNGDVSLVNFNSGASISINAGTRDVEALLVWGTDYLQAWIPADFITDQGALTISLSDDLESSQISTVQSIFPGFAVQSKVLRISSQNSVVSDSVPIIHYRMSGATRFDTQWIKLNGNRLDSWESSGSTWVQDQQQLITFVNGSGSYFLASPLDNQNTVNLPLDGSFHQIYLPDLWLDLSTAQSPGYSVNLRLPRLNQDLPSDYFSANPFTINGNYQSFAINLLQGRQTVESLPGGKWFELGFRLQNPRGNSTRLTRIYRTDQTDHLDYKTYATQYDDNHYTTQGDYLYCGINSSGTYILGATTESAAEQSIPCLKPQLKLQCNQSYISWSDNSLPCNSINLSYNIPIAEAHPWLSGYPYNLSGNALLKLTAKKGTAYVDELPENFFLSLKYNRRLSSVINFSPRIDYPQFYRYRAAADFAHNSFVYAEGRIQISPAVAGYLIDASSASGLSSGELALFGRMVFDDYDWELYMDSRRAMRSGTLLSFASASGFTDRFNVFANQYQFSHLGPVHSFRVLNDPGFYALYKPYIRIKQSNREQNLLFTEINADYYRIYSYSQAEQADGWSFSLNDGHIAFVLAHDGEFGAVSEPVAHQYIDVAVTNTEDLHVSLYQAQLVVPGEYVGSIIPMGAHFSLRELIELPPGITARTAYQVQIRGPQQSLITPNFFNYPEQERYPYLYMPVPDYVPGQIPRLFYRDQAGLVRQLTYVPSFSASPEYEFSIVGNCVVCFINNSGIFFIQ